MFGKADVRQPECRRRGRKRGGRRSARGGFTLIETALATVIVGVGVLAIVAAQQAFHKQNICTPEVDRPFIPLGDCRIRLLRSGL